MNTMECSHLSTTYQAQPISYVRFLHAVPAAPAVDVYSNGNLIVRSLSYKQVTGYFAVTPGRYHIEVFATGKQSELLAQACFEVCKNSAVTIALIGTEVGLLAVTEIYEVCKNMRDRCKAYLRFVNLAPNAPAVDVSLSGGTTLFRNVPYTAHTRYKSINPGTYAFVLKPAGSSQPGLVLPTVTLEKCKAYSAYAVGDVGGVPPLEIIIIEDGNY